MRPWCPLLMVAAAAAASLVAAPPRADLDAAVREVRSFNFRAVRDAVEDLSLEFGKRYPRGSEYLRRLAELERARDEAGEESVVELARRLRKLRHEALLANPLLDFDKLLLVKRSYRAPIPRPTKKRPWATSPFYTGYGLHLGLPVNHYSIASIEPHTWDNEIAVLSPVRPDGRLTTFYRPDDRAWLGEMELHWDADRLLFTMPVDGRYRVFEIGASGDGLRQITPDNQPDVDNFDAAYLPNGKVIFGGNASYQAVPCWHGLQTVACLYSINADGTGMRQLTFDQDEDSHPTVLNTGQVLFCRWEYTNTPHVFPHLLFAMNPDGTSQREFYGSGSYWPNAIYYPRAIPGEPTKIVGVVSGYHGDYRMGELFLIDPALGRNGASGMVQKIPDRGDEIKVRIKDRLTSASWPKFLQPHPLSDKYFLVSAKTSPESPWGIYLVDVFDNMLLLHEAPGYALLEPVPLKSAPKPPVVPDKVDHTRKDAVVYMHDVYTGPGLAGVPRGTVKKLRVHAYHFGYRGLTGWSKIGIDGPWEVMRILGTVPVDEDGSAMFRAPANTPIAVQPLDERGRAVQIMRSWFTAMPGEVRSCVGCHESQNTLPPVRSATAATREPSEIEPFYGPARGFDFAREIQPVLDYHCTGCHDGSGNKPDFRAESFHPGYEGKWGNVPTWWGEVDENTYRPELLRSKKRKHIKIKYTPAYEALIPYVRRYGLEGDYVLPYPGEYSASTSELIQMLEQGHHGVRLDREAWEKLFTWIDLNVPCHGTWSDVFPIPFNGRERRIELAKLYAGVDTDAEAVPETPLYRPAPVAPGPERCCEKTTDVPGWPFDLQEARERQGAAGSRAVRTLDLGDGLSLKLMLIPAGEFPGGRVKKPFWMGAVEISNQIYALFDAKHDSRYINLLGGTTATRGFAVNQPDQPVVRVSQQQALEFCRWLSNRTGLAITLPTEAQWEWAARAGTGTPFHFGAVQTSFDQHANMADRSIEGFVQDTRQRSFLMEIYPDWMLRVKGVDDGHMVTAPVGSYYSNAWGLHDVHGNAAEWTLSDYDAGRKVVRGGSWYDRPHRCRSDSRYGYPGWLRVYNVGFRVAMEAGE